MTSTLVGGLPLHRYVVVDSTFCARGPRRWLPAVWFGLVSYPGRAWGATVLFESGAIYRNLPLHALAETPQTVDLWTVRDAQQWDCYGWDFAAHVYPYLHGLRCQAKTASGIYPGTYAFSVAPMGDGFSAAPDQAKEFTFVTLDNGRWTAQPTDRLLFEDRSFTHRAPQWPTDLLRQQITYSAEDPVE